MGMVDMGVDMEVIMGTITCMVVTQPTDMEWDTTMYILTHLLSKLSKTHELHLTLYTRLYKHLGSIAMMLESTFFAVHSSFRAVLGVADHFSRLRENHVQIVGENFLIKWLQSVFRKIMVLIGLRSSASVEEVWNEMRSMTRDSTRQSQSRAWKSWPLLLFFGVVLGTPWLIWRFLSSLGSEDINNWMSGTYKLNQFS